MPRELLPRETPDPLQYCSAPMLSPAHLDGPIGQARRPDAELAGTRADVDVVAHAVEPLEHDGKVGAELADLLDRHLHEREAPAHGLAQDPRRLGHGVLVSRDVDL